MTNRGPRCAIHDHGHDRDWKLKHPSTPTAYCDALSVVTPHEGCGGGGGKTVAYANSKVYVRQLLDTTTTTNVDLIFDAASGKQLGTFKSSVIPAFGATTGFFLGNGELSAIDIGTGNPNWSFAGDGQLVSAPIVIDNVVVMGSSSGMVYAIGNAGNVLWSGSAGAPIAAPDEQNAMLLTGFGAGDGYLVVPAGNVLNGWRVIP
jgi:outer membrane protein assembly factor BamB